jgi:hypothetical protein
MSRPGEIVDDKLRAILALIERIDEQIGPTRSLKARRKSASKPRATASASRSSESDQPSQAGVKGAARANKAA